MIIYAGFYGNAPSRAEETVRVMERWTILAEVAIQGRGEPLEGHAEHSVQTLEHGDRQRPLETKPLVSLGAEHRL